MNECGFRGDMPLWLGTTGVGNLDVTSDRGIVGGL